ncbi:MAG: peptidoglycan bridge formation glycyltransferase FemA/FemB family protein [Candidatus Andersenbacteria bacterium]
MIIRPITSEAVWEDFVHKLQPNTFLQSWAWGQLQQEIGEEVQYLGFFDGETQVGAALLLTVRARRGQHYLCPHGPLFTEERFIEEGIATLMSFAKEQARGSALRLAPLLVVTPEHTALLARHGFRSAPLHVHTELTWMLDLSPTPEELMQGMRKTTRHAIRRATDKGVTASILSPEEIVSRFYPLYEATKDRHGFVPFSRRFLETQVGAYSPNNVFGVVAQFEGHDVAAAILIHYGDTVFYHHGASLQLPGNIPAAHLLQWTAIQEAKRRGATRYNFWGIAPDNEPEHPFAGITVFKKGFGGYAVDYMHAQDLPLSWKYWSLWAVEMLRKKKRGF